MRKMVAFKNCGQAEILIIFSMQIQPISVNTMSDQLIYDEFLDSGFNITNSNLDFPILTKNHSLPQPNHKVGPRGKEKPKGEKNTKNALKQTKSAVQENQRKGHWSREENKKYHWFLEVFSYHFIVKAMRRLERIFTTMSRFIGSREAEQCRSHHQKMQKKHQSFTNIILFLRNLHYGEDGTHLLQQDLMANQIAITDTLLSVKQLTNEKCLKSKSSILSVSEEAKVDELKEDSCLYFQGEDDDILQIDNFLF